MCGDFQRGNCSRGDSCRFSHGGGGGGKDKGKGKAKGKGEDWKCLFCSENVFAQKTECYKCGTPKGSTEPPAKGKGKGGKDGKGDRPFGVPPPPGRYSEELWEKPREEMGLKLIGEEPSCAGANWQYPLNDANRRSYGGLLKCPFTQETNQMFYQAVKDGIEWIQPMGPHGPIPRQTAWLVSPGCSCTYRYGSIEVPPQEYPPFMIELMNQCMPYFGCADQSQWPNSCNVNLYEDGGASVGWHGDDERIFNGKFQDIRILSLSLGQRRKFELRVNYVSPGERPEKLVMLNSGDLMTMEGMCQKHYQHRVPKEHGVSGPRINLTWRWNVKHTPQCPVSRMRR